jgi:hypothetical protein
MVIDPGYLAYQFGGHWRANDEVADPGLLDRIGIRSSPSIVVVFTTD